MVTYTDSASTGLSVIDPKLATAKSWIDIPPKALIATTAPKSPIHPEIQKANPKGLSSSRWADKPVENEGKFAGF